MTAPAARDHEPDNAGRGLVSAKRARICVAPFNDPSEH